MKKEKLYYLHYEGRSGTDIRGIEKSNVLIAEHQGHEYRLDNAYDVAGLLESVRNQVIKELKEKILENLGLNDAN